MSVENVLKEYNKFINVTTPVTYFPSSLLSLNEILGGGLRSGRLYEIVGDRSAGKTTLSLDFIANAQKNGYTCVYVDFERTYDEVYAKTCGVSDDLIIVKADTTETGLTIVEELIKAGAKVIVIDSIPAAVPSSEMDKDYNDSEKMASAAGIITRFCKRIVPIADNHGAIIITLNQYRANISTMSRKEKKFYGPFQLHYTASAIIELVRIKNEDTNTIVRATLDKNKTGAEKLSCEFTVIYGKGLDVAAEVIEYAIDKGIIQKKGAWYYYGELKAQGLEQAKELFPIGEIRNKLMRKE
jgi:recombination protein RecA